MASQVGSVEPEHAVRGEVQADALMSQHRQDRDRVVVVPIASLLAADSPRLAGVSIDHARALAESQAQLLPIVVHGVTMRVIDGMHRLQAAMLRGEEAIEVRYFEGDEAEAFVLAVQANVAHGLPLTLADRTAAAVRIIRSFPQWSDRRIAAITGLSPKTIGAVRSRSTEEIPQLSVRVGRDGRARRVNHRGGGRTTDEGKVNGADAKQKDVRAVVGSVSDPARSKHDPEQDGGPDAPKKRRQEQRTTQPEIGKQTSGADHATTVRALRNDPSLRFTETGRLLLRLLDLHSIGEHEWGQLIATVPPHCANQVTDLARGCAEAWRTFAERVTCRRAV
jgi:ParB-like chromosome segregation protein Spo0J